LLRCVSICLEYSQHRAERHNIDGVIERRRIQARSAASVKKNGIRAFQPVSEKAYKRMKDKAAHACRALCRARVAEELQRRRGTQIAEHLKLLLSIIDRQQER
jgi:hypothetical protein